MLESAVLRAQTLILHLILALLKYSPIADRKVRHRLLPAAMTLE